METVFSETHRLRFRNLRPSDYDAVRAFRSDPVACRYAADPLTPDEVTAHIARCKDGWSRREGETLCLAAELRSDGAVVGEAMIRYVSLRDRHAESRVALAPRCFRTGLGRGRANHRGALRRQFAGNRLADAAAGAGDNRDFSLQ